MQFWNSVAGVWDGSVRVDSTPPKKEVAPRTGCASCNFPPVEGWQAWPPISLSPSPPTAETLLEGLKSRKSMIASALDEYQRSIEALRKELELVDALLDAGEQHAKACPSHSPRSS